MITKQQALDLHYHETLHYGNCTRTVGSRGGVKTNIKSVRVSGQVKTWKRSPERFDFPVKFGMYESWHVDEVAARNYHRQADCPLVNVGIE